MARLFIIPHTHQVYFDEFEHINIAQNIFYSNKFCACAAGSAEVCNSCELVQWPPGYHTFLSLMFSLFNDSEQVAFNTNAIIGSISIIFIFLLIFLIFKNSSFALIGAFIFSFIPVHLKYSGSSSLEIFSLFFMILCIISLEIYVKTKKYASFLLFLIILLYTVQIRPENFLLIFIFSFYLMIKLSNQIRKLFNTKYLITILIFFIMLIPLIQLINYTSLNSYQTYLTNHFMGWDGSLLTKISYIKHGFVSNFVLFLNYKFNPLILSFLFILGSIEAYLKNKKLFYYYISFFLLFFLVYTYHMGNLYPGDTVRYSIILYLPFIIISINSINFILRHIAINRKVLIFLIALIFLMSLVPTKNFIFSKHRLNNEYEFVLSMDDKLPSDVYIISYNTPIITATIHKKSISPYKFESFGLIGSEKNAILFKDFWWYDRLQQSNKFEDKLKDYYFFELIEKDFSYGFYNLTLK
ncbi:MAG: glycosyltransferase family 39 protein [Nanoarchaeota archaeon]|nr:glycosyltransferase family 39 protein [Nanoarchaeota archaeon]